MFLFCFENLFGDVEDNFIFLLSNMEGGKSYGHRD